jgi:uncharacterized protein YcbX
VPYLARITIFPIKSLDGVSLGEAALTSGGSLVHDREFCLVDASGKVVNGKRTARVHQVRATFDLAAQTVDLRASAEEAPRTFHLHGDRTGLEDWFGRFFGFPVSLRHDTTTGFPDDPHWKGPTVVGEQTLSEVASWFHGLTVDDARRRFRANLEIADVPAFWEDRLYDQEGSAVRFSVGAVTLEGMMPWPRCAVPSRNPLTGDEDPGFRRRFAQQRQATLPWWAAQSRFDHFYKLCVGTRAPGQAGRTLRVGDGVRILETSADDSRS